MFNQFPTLQLLKDKIHSFAPFMQVRTYLSMSDLLFTGNALATVKSSDPIKLITVRATAFEKAKEKANEAAVETGKEVPAVSPVPEFVKDEVKASARPELQSARVVISGGRALKSSENFKILEAFADQIGAAGLSFISK